ncbi:serine/threonine protein kinase [Enhygromyxa salina]|uniref:Serine/threonine protein kinase n=1 Tax=Enhygromyxa salina TaxID=215803 RepID=A0A0C2D097_9BACT|nr:serine/threonine-protein kinase [Enhygromyxa salina]KIG13577.1 serine/threonine protein kinase [Enhygromyxa salina]
MARDRKLRFDAPTDVVTLVDDTPPSNPLAPEPGDLLEHVYRILRLQGRGGGGTVMLAHDETLDRLVALKFLHPTLTELETQRTRFLNEARAMARIRHPNVVGIHGVGHWEGIPYLVMEYLAGPTLQAYLEDHDHELALDDAIGLFDQMCRGVAAIHEAGATHNDLKPSNMIIGPASRLGITDFGLAEWARKQGMRRGGTIGFIAPEIIRGESVPAPLRTAADIYSLGVLAFILFAGRMPFGNDSIEGVVGRQLATESPKPSALRPGLPRELDEPVSQALSRHPAARPRRADELLRACSDALSGRSTSVIAPRILAIEDDLVMHPWLEASLHAVLPDASVACFASPLAALADAKINPPQLVITDLNMPEMTGFEVVQALRARAHTRHVPIIAITGSAGQDDWDRLTILGADGFLAKPFQPWALRAVVRRMLVRARGD